MDKKTINIEGIEIEIIGQHAIRPSFRSHTSYTKNNHFLSSLCDLITRMKIIQPANLANILNSSFTVCAEFISNKKKIQHWDEAFHEINDIENGIVGRITYNLLRRHTEQPDHIKHLLDSMSATFLRQDSHNENLKEITNFADKYKKMEAINEKAPDGNAHLEKEMESSSERIIYLERQVSELQQTVAELSGKIDTYKAEIDAIIKAHNKGVLTDETEIATNRLLQIFNDPKKVKDYIKLTQSCKSADDFARMVIIPLVKDNVMFIEEVAKKENIERFMPFLTFSKGNTVENIRRAIHKRLDMVKTT